jgi:undecaprenyl-phosphate galactose phosphotransferase
MPNDSASSVAARLGPGVPVFRFPHITPTLRRIAVASQGFIVACADLAAVGAATLLGACVGGRLTGPWHFSPPHHLRDILAVADPSRAGYGFAAVLLVLLAQLARSGHYASRTPAWSRAQDVVSAVALAGLCDLFLVLPEAGGTRGAGWLAMWLSLVPFIVASRGAARFAMARLGLWDVRIVLFGEPDHTARAAEAMRSESRACLRVVGHFQRHEVGDASDPARWRGLMASTGGNYIALVGAPADAMHEARAMVALERTGIPFALIHPTGGLPVAQWRPRYFFSHDVLMLVSSAGRPGVVSRGLKRLMDIAAASFLLATLSPLLIAIAVLVRRDGGSALFYHQRLGACGRFFHCVKFRSMRVDSDAVLHELLERDPAAAAEWAATQKLRNDPRVTPIGRFLRQTSLDELPQLLNVLRGHMSLVGPRPIVAAEARFYGDHICDYYTARPGVTGLWQVSGRSDTSYQRRVQLDVWYARNRSLWHDLGIIVKTVPVVLFRKGAV